jgi:trk system potassium uptake protein TrkH
MAKNAALATLSFAARPAVVAKYVGQLMLVVAALTVIPLAVAILDAELDMAWRLAGTALALGALGGAVARLGGQPRIQANEALAIAALSYLATAVAMIVPFRVHGLSTIDALFESVSAITTTGLSTLTDVESMPRSFLFLRAWMQWYGGLGIVVLSVALLVGDDAVARRLVDTDLTENLVTTTRLHARRMIAVYAALTLVGLACIALSGMPLFDAACHVLAAISTGGFSTHDRSLAGFAGGWQRAAVMGVCVLGAVSLPLYVQLYRRNWRSLAQNEEIRALVAMIVVATALIYVLEGAFRPDDPDAFANAAVLAVSAQSTAGFSTVSPASLGPAAKFIVILAMAVGGCIGSTAGGVKLLRMLLAFRLVGGALRRTSLATGAVDEPQLSGRRIGADEMLRACMVIAVFFAGILLSWLPFLAAGRDPLDALFEVVSATGTVGLSAGVTSADLEPGLKGVLCADMLFGRVEFLALLVLLYPRTWFGKRRLGE